MGQDLADEFVAIKDYDGAKEVMEQHVLPVVNEAGLVHRLIQVRSQYAVILALSGQHKAADVEMQRLAPYIEGLWVYSVKKSKSIKLHRTACP